MVPLSPAPVAATSSAKGALAQGRASDGTDLAYVGCYTPPGEGIVALSRQRRYRQRDDAGERCSAASACVIHRGSHWILCIAFSAYAVNEDEPSGGVGARSPSIIRASDLKLNQQSGFARQVALSTSKCSSHPAPASSCWWRITVLETSLCSQFFANGDAFRSDPTDMESDTGALEPAQSGRQSSRQFRAQRSYRAEDAHDPDRILPGSSSSPTMPVSTRR